MAAETCHLLSHLQGPCRRCCIFRTRFLPPTCSPELPFSFLTSCFSRWRLSGSPVSGVGVQGWTAKRGSALTGGVIPSAEWVRAMPGGGWYREPVWLMPSADAAAAVHGVGSSQRTSLSPWLSPGRGVSGSQGCSKGSEPSVLQLLIVLGCAMLAMVCYTAAAVLCQTAPHHARLYHTVLQLSPCGTGYGNTMHHSTILHHAVLHHAGHAMPGCIMLSVPHWHATSALHLDSCVVSCHATLCHIMLAMPCHAAWCCLC